MRKFPYTFTCFLSFLLLTTFSCKERVKSKLEYAIESAGENKDEILKVIKYYEQRKEDSLKLKAARYLISNMPEQTSYLNNDTRTFDSLSHILGSIEKYDNIDVEEKDVKITTICDSFRIEHKLSNISTKRDIEVLSSSYLIDNINDAFTAWQTFPWSRNISFESFCENILPYKVFTEPISPHWRKAIMKEFAWVKDSIKEKKSLREAVLLINNAIRGQMSYSSSMKRIPLVLSFNNLKKGKVGNCEHLITYITYVLKAMGIPSMIDFTPAWGNNSSGHTWGAIIDENNKLFTYDALYNDSKIEDLEHTNVIPEGVLRNRKTPKVYRISYQKREPSSNDENGATEISNSYWLDVTREYNFLSKDVNLQLQKEADVKTIYLCVYNANKWKPCVLGTKDSLGRYQFKDLGTGIIYLPAILTPSTIEPISSPFLLTDSGTAHYITPNLYKKQVIVVNRKSNIDYDLLMALKSTIGGQFQGSNNKAFLPATNLFTIESMPLAKTNIFQIHDSNFYRYVRYIKQSGLCRVAELRFYGILKNNTTTSSSNDTPLEGRVFSSEAKASNISDNVFDNDVLSYFVSSSNKNGFIGLDLGANNLAKITKIEFYPPNDGNTVEVGDTYELFYWDNDWISLKKHKSQAEELVFNDCPSNALFRLRNLTKGYKERIFTYENETQVWW